MREDQKNLGASYIYSRFDGMTKLYNLLAEMPRTYGISEMLGSKVVVSENQATKKAVPEIADMTDNLVRSVVHAVAFGRKRTLTGSIGCPMVLM